MTTNTPEYLAQEVFEKYGIEIPLDVVISYLDSDSYLTPELYSVISQMTTSVILKILARFGDCQKGSQSWISVHIVAFHAKMESTYGS